MLLWEEPTVTNFLLEIFNLPHNKITNAIRLLSGTVLPGFLIILMYSKEFFLNADVVKLTMLSLSLTAPLVFINGILTSSILDHAKNAATGEDLKKFENIGELEVFFGGFAITGLVLFLGIILSHILWFKRFFFPIIIIIAELSLGYGYNKALTILKKKQ